MRLPALLLVTLVAMTTAIPAQADPTTGRFDRPHTGFAPPWTELHAGALEQAPIDAALERVRRYTEADASGHPLFSGAVTLMVHDGAVVANQPTGWAVRYADQTTELPVERRVPMAEDTIFDLASSSKLFSSLAVMPLVEAGRVRVDERV